MYGQDISPDDRPIQTELKLAKITIKNASSKSPSSRLSVESWHPGHLLEQSGVCRNIQLAVHDELCDKVCGWKCPGCSLVLKY